ncbi:MAG: protein-export chaperone SecB [Kiloniellales bacterium]
MDEKRSDASDSNDAPDDNDVADDNDSSQEQPPEAAADPEVFTPPRPPFTIHRQYLKDLSFENPNAPEIFTEFGDEGPDIKVRVELASEVREERTYEVVINLEIKAYHDDTAAFIIDLQYAALVTIAEGLTNAQTNRWLLVATPRYVFPFVRAVVANATRDGGFPPLLLNPIDFQQVQRNQRKVKPRTEPANV